MFFKKSVLKKIANFTGKHLSWSLFLIMLQTRRPAALLKRDSDTDVFLEHFFYRTLPVAASVHSLSSTKKLAQVEVALTTLVFI